MAIDNKNKVLNVPHLRFPEFSGEWKNTSLGKIGKTFNGLTGKSGADFGRGFPYITYKSIFDDSKIDISRVEYVEITDVERKKETQNEVQYGDVFFTTSSETPDEVGMSSVLLDEIKDCYLNSFCFGYRLNSLSKTIPDYMRFYLRSQTIRKKMFVLAQGSTRFNISKSEVMGISINIPETKEQRKIANLLTLLDERIATQNKIIEDLKKLKCAIIEKLYSKIQGKEYSYGQLFDVVNERNKQMEYSNILSASQEKGMVNRDDLNLDIQFERSNINTYKIVRKGDYVIHLRSFQGGFAFSDKLGVCSPAYTILRPNSLLEYSYLSYYFTSQRFIKSLIIVTYGIRDGRSINVEEWLNMKVVIPSKEHQLHTLNVLKRIDDKVENEEKYATCLSNQKQYLLRQMFI